MRVRANRDAVFIATLILALLASTGVALSAWAGAGSSRQVIQVSGGGDFTGSAEATTTAGGTSGSSGTGSGQSSSGNGGSGAVGVTGDTIKIGGIFSESGGIDSTVEEDTVRACFQRVNAQGGINGHKLQLVAYDDGLNADTAYQEAVRLDTQDHVFAIVGWLAPFGEARAAPYFEQHGIPIVGGLGVPEEFNNKYSFPLSPIFHTDGYLLGSYGAGKLPFHHIGVFLTQTAGINDVANGIKDGAKANGVTVNNNDIVFVPFAATNFDNYLLQFQSAGVDGLVTQLDPFTYVRLYQSMQRTNKIFPHLAGAGIDKQNVDQAIGAPLVGVHGFMPYREAQGNPDGNGEVALYNNTVARYFRNQVPNMDAFSEGSWVACRVFTQALQKLGANVTREGLVKALNSGVYGTGGMAPDLNYGATGGRHDASRRATYITYNSSRRWQTVQGFTCH
jgi:branched-chain amino acid transport system substrate-binding protein